MKKLVIYTVLTGNYDNLRQPESIVDDFDYICFSNDITKQRIGIWEIRSFDYHNNNNTRESRFPKLNPHLVLSEYEYSLYIDAKIRIDDSVNIRAAELINNDCQLAMIPHPMRDCVYQEAMTLTCSKIGEPELVYKQTRFLLKEKFPAGKGLFDCAVIFRKHNNTPVAVFSKTWWEIYCSYSSRDQMSVTYALYKAGLSPEIFLPASFYRNHVFEHLKKRKNFSELSFISKILLYLNILRMRLLYKVHGLKY
ncbi:MAG: DUF616 domain-containing protein [Lentisphaerae bacterium]|nr:DUF616 domain-containing protein [Lentisphaerota bacterium]